MNNSKPIAIWVRIGAGLVAGLGAVVIAGLAAAWILGRVGPPKWTWYQWAIGLWSFWVIYPMFLSVAVKGDLSWCGSLLDKVPNTKLRILANGVFWILMLVASLYYDPAATNLFLILGALLIVYLVLDVYFMPVRSKLEAIAKIKARHGIPADQPHRIDDILKSGFFRR